jgi:uncharacterized protein YqeY
MEKSLNDRLNADFMIAFKNKEMEKKNFLGLIKSEISNELGRSQNSSATDELVLAIIKKMEKSLIQTNTKESLAELEYIKEYLPNLMNKEEITKIVKDLISEGTVESLPQVMAHFNKNYKGLVDNKLVSEVSKELFK